MRIAALGALDRNAEASAKCEALMANYPNIVQAIRDFRISCQDALIGGLK